MKLAAIFFPVLTAALLTSPAARAQMPSRAAVLRPAPAAVVQSPRAQPHQQEPRAAASLPTFQMVQFTFRTGGDDLRDDSVVTAMLRFPDGGIENCHLHGARASGAAANISWENNSTHEAAPCLLRKPRTLSELKQARTFISLSAPGSEPTFGAVIGSGGLAALSVRSQDNWNIEEADMKAYNADPNTEACVRSVSGDPVARLTGDQPYVILSDFPNQCR